MRRMLGLGGVVFVACGCTWHYEIDLAEVGAFQDFEWDGTIRVRNVSRGLLDSPGIDRIELGSEDGRIILVETEGSAVKAYVEVKVRQRDAAEVREQERGDMEPAPVGKPG